MATNVNDHNAGTAGWEALDLRPPQRHLSAINVGKSTLPFTATMSMDTQRLRLQFFQHNVSPLDLPLNVIQQPILRKDEVVHFGITRAAVENWAKKHSVDLGGEGDTNTFLEATFQKKEDIEHFINFAAMLPSAAGAHVEGDHRHALVIPAAAMGAEHPVEEKKEYSQHLFHQNADVLTVMMGYADHDSLSALYKVNSKYRGAYELKAELSLDPKPGNLQGNDVYGVTMCSVEEDSRMHFRPIPHGARHFLVPAHRHPITMSRLTAPRQPFQTVVAVTLMGLDDLREIDPNRFYMPNVRVILIKNLRNLTEIKAARGIVVSSGEVGNLRSFTLAGCPKLQRIVTDPIPNVPRLEKLIISDHPCLEDLCRIAARSYDLRLLQMIGVPKLRVNMTTDTQGLRPVTTLWWPALNRVDMDPVAEASEEYVQLKTPVDQRLADKLRPSIRDSRVVIVHNDKGQPRQEVDLGYGAPDLVRVDGVHDITDFKERWKDFSQGQLTGLDLASLKLHISGGAMYYCLSKNAPEGPAKAVRGDIDLYFGQVTMRQMQETLQQVVRKVVENRGHRAPFTQVVWRPMSVTIYGESPYRPIQVILKWNPSINHIAAHMDLPVCGIVWQGGDSPVMALPEGLQGLTTGVQNCYDMRPTASINMTLKRLQKYNSRGVTLAHTSPNYSNCDFASAKTATCDPPKGPQKWYSKEETMAWLVDEELRERTTQLVDHDLMPWSYRVHFIPGPRATVCKTCSRPISAGGATQQGQSLHQSLQDDWATTAVRSHEPPSMDGTVVGNVLAVLDTVPVAYVLNNDTDVGSTDLPKKKKKKKTVGPRRPDVPKPSADPVLYPMKFKFKDGKSSRRKRNR